MWIGRLTLVSTLTNSPVSLSSIVAGTLFPWAMSQMRCFAVLDHLAQLGELGREVDDAEGRLAAAVDVAAVDGSIIVKELEVLFLDGGVQRLQVRRGRCGQRRRRGPRPAWARVAGNLRR